MNEEKEDYEEPKMGLFRRILVITIVLLLTLMLIMLIIMQPRFFTFLT